MRARQPYPANPSLCLITCTAFLLCSVSYPALAAFKLEQDRTAAASKPRLQKQQQIGSTKEPVLLESSYVEYDQVNDVISASGNVQVVQGESIILADQLQYDQANDVVKARGHVSLLAPSGDVYFADEMELTDDLKAGIVRQFKARLADNSLFVASGARRVNEDYLEMYNASYTPCKCETKEGAPKNPMWQISADRITVDEKQQEVSYKNAYFKSYGVPVIYTPYFSHPTPNADNESGLLMPEFLHSSQLGSVYKQPIYYSISPDKDVTLTPIITSEAGPVFAGQYRQLFNSGPLTIDGSITSAPNRDALGNHAPGHELRGNIDALGKFQLNDNYDWGFNIRRATDDTYLRLYNFSNDTLLTSRLYGEGFNFVPGGYDRTYGIVQALSFQGLTGQDDSRLIPVVAPLADFTWQSNPGIYNSRVTFDADAMSLYRRMGDDSRRLSGTLGWKLPYITSNGQVIEFTARMRTDIYDVDGVQLSDGRTYTGITGREVPEASVVWRYPFINRWEGSSLMIEPIVEADVSPGGGNPEKIPNEDSLLPEFSDANLFSPDRFAGYDRIESGPRISYGMRGQAQLYTDKYIDWLIGQHYRTNDDPSFPLSNDLTSHFSDYVGKVGLSYKPFSIAYRFRLDKDTLAPHRTEVDGSFDYYPLTLATSYLQLKNDPVIGDKEIINGGVTLNLTKEWAVGFTGSQDILLNQTETAYANLTFKNECVTLTSMVGKDYTNLLDVKPSTTFWFRVSLKNLE